MELIELMIKYHGDIAPLIAALGAELELLLQGYAIVTIDESKIARLYESPKIEHIELPRRLSFESINFLESTCVTEVQSAAQWDLRGAGVLVAVIDSGLDYLHPDFRHADGTTRLRYIWDQTAKRGRPPLGFLSGAQYDKAEIDEALRMENPRMLVPYDDELGHGTAVTGIAAGGGRAARVARGGAMGVAPEAALISVKIGTRGYPNFARTTEVMRAVAYVIGRARALDMPLAINLSLGMNDGSHRGESLFERYLDAAADEWKCVLVAPTGNEGAAGHHFDGRLSSFETKDIEFFTAAGLDSFYISMWKDFTDTLSVELLVPSGGASGVVNMHNQIRRALMDNMEIRLSYGQPSHYSVRQQIYIEVEAREGLLEAGLWRLRIQTGEIVSGEVELWLPTLEAVGAQTFFPNSSEADSMTIPATAQKLIAVAGYRAETDSILDFSGKAAAESRGQKPDLAAPAYGVLAAQSGGGYDTVTGTSFAAPFVTGAAALLLQWGIVQKNDPFLYGQRSKAFLRLGATRAANRDYPNNAWGYGALCVERSMDYLRKYKLGGGREPWRTW